jgi:hypothetical protein
MCYLEVSKKIKLTREITQEDLKNALITRLRRAFVIDSIREDAAGFQMQGSTVGFKSLSRHTKVDLNIQIAKTNENARIIIFGHSHTPLSLLITYSLLFLAVLLVGLLPGSLETGGDTSGPADVLVLTIFGLFIFYDINKKLDVPKESLEAALQSLETEFG